MRDGAAGGGGRIAMVDALRGYALLGLFLVHMTGYFELYNARPVPSWVQDGTTVLFQGKSFSLLALCFGFSFFVMIDGARRRGTRFVPRFAWRLTILFAIGWLHALLYRGEIIVVLAVAGFVLIPIDRIRSNRALAALAAVLFAQPLLLARMVAGWLGAEWGWQDPLFYDDGGAMAPSLSGDLGDVVRANIVAGKVSKWSYFIETGRLCQIVGLFVAGLLFGRTGFFAEPRYFRRLRNGALAGAALALFPLMRAADATCCHRTGPLYWTNLLVSGWNDLAGMTVALMLFMLAWEWGKGRGLRLLAPCGRMTLTLYVGQSLIFVPVFYGFGLHWWDRISQVQSLLLGIAAFAVQLAFATIWFRAFAYGPLEWLWRAATSLSLDTPFRRRPDALKAAAR